MNANYPDEKAVFKVAIGIETPELRRDYLDQICGDNPALRQRVLNLLQMQAEEPEFLAASPVGFVATIGAPGMAETVGAQIGPYKLREQIGEGGMGVVYVAEQTEPVRRKVALKIIKPGMDSKQVIARFEAERQALALMNHPHIAQVLDGGATDVGSSLFRHGIGAWHPDHGVLRQLSTHDTQKTEVVHRCLPCDSARPSKRDHPP